MGNQDNRVETGTGREKWSEASGETTTEERRGAIRFLDFRSRLGSFEAEGDGANRDRISIVRSRKKGREWRLERDLAVQKTIHPNEFKKPNQNNQVTKENQRKVSSTTNKTTNNSLTDSGVNHH